VQAPVAPVNAPPARRVSAAAPAPATAPDAPPSTPTPQAAASSAVPVDGNAFGPA
jgi:hypothetical protein